jgi:hypothetical protein
MLRQLDAVESTTRINDPDFASDPTTEVRPTLIPSGRDQCAACGVRMTADQRYCVECGQRRGAPRFQFMEGVAQRQREAAAPPRRSRRSRLSPNATLIAGVGTLLLAMGIGVLIGRSGNNSSGSAKSPAVQVVSVAGGASGAAGATPAPIAGAAGAGGKKGKSGGGSSSSSSGGAGATPPPKVVTVGSPGKGPGYQKGKFTGNFFGQ